MIGVTSVPCATGGYVVNVLATTFDIAFNFVILSMLT